VVGGKAGIVRTISSDDNVPETEASIENNPAPEVGRISDRMALLWKCDCDTFHVTTHKVETIQRNISYGSREAQLRDGGMTCEGVDYSKSPIEVCGKKNQRINSAKTTKVLAAVPCARPASVRNLRYIAEQLNILKGMTNMVGTGANPRGVEYTINEMWFEAARGVKQGKGKKFWCRPIRRWQAWLRGEF
jgi:hypothetical protein